MSFKIHPPDLAETPFIDPLLRQRARELVMLELKYQPWLRFRMFTAGFIAGTALSLGLHAGLHFLAYL